MLYTYDLHHNFCRSLNVEKFNLQLIFHNSNTGDASRRMLRHLTFDISTDEKWALE